MIKWSETKANADKPDLDCVNLIVYINLIIIATESFKNRTVIVCGQNVINWE